MFDKFRNQDLARNREKYFEGVGVKPSNLKVTQLNRNTFVLDVYCGDEEPLIEYDTYFYPTQMEAGIDALILYIKYLEYRFEKKHATQCMVCKSFNTKRDNDFPVTMWNCKDCGSEGNEDEVTLNSKIGV
jgi:hypothetical protein